MLKPRQPAPPLTVSTVDGAPWRLSDQRPGTFTLVVFYRGAHCEHCRAYLQALEVAKPAFELRGVTVVAVSMDDAEAAYASYRNWGLAELPVGYGVSADQAAAWGLFFTGGRTESEPVAFSEPGQFLVRPDGRLFLSQVQSGPFARPPVEALLTAVDALADAEAPATGALSPERIKARRAA